MSESQSNETKTTQLEEGLVYCFGDFEFEPEKDELRNEHHSLCEKLEPQVAQLLTLFVENQGTVITKEAIQQTLWPKAIVEQNSLYQLLTKLRKLLNDSSRNPTFIKTLPKKGYSFIHPVSIQTSIQPEVSVKSTQKLRSPLLWLVPAIIICFSAIAFFNTDKKSLPIPEYDVHDVSYELGLETDIDVHINENLMAYVKDIYSLHIATKQGDVFYKLASKYRVAMPAWQEKNRLLAYWQYREDQCELFIISPQGAISHQAPPIACESALKPVWKNPDEIVVSVKQKGQLIPYLYRLGTQVLTQVPVVQPTQSEYKGAVKAWQGHTYYLFNHADHTSSLIELDGTVAMSWPFPVWLIGYNPKTQAIISNDQSQRHRIIATHRDSQSYEVLSTANGLFTNLSVDNQGDIYTSIESWQVNIRDKDNLPIFSTSSIDYLPVSNALGETAFMSRRSGVCEVYLHADDQITRLSFHKGYEFVKFLEWRPDLSMLLSNRDMDIAIYDRQQLILQFTSSLDNTIKNLGWYDNHTIFAFDGSEVQFYDLQGRITGSHPLKAQFIYFDTSNNSWLVLKDNVLYQQASFDSVPVAKQTLTAQQSNLLHNVRIKNNSLYWQSAWSKQDHIWRLKLTQGADVELVKKGNLIWHFDISPYEELTIAKMEAIEGDIKRISPMKPQQSEL